MLSPAFFKHRKSPCSCGLRASSIFVHHCEKYPIKSARLLASCVSSPDGSKQTQKLDFGVILEAQRVSKAQQPVLGLPMVDAQFFFASKLFATPSKLKVDVGHETETDLEETILFPCSSGFIDLHKGPTSVTSLPEVFDQKSIYKTVFHRTGHASRKAWRARGPKTCCWRARRRWRKMWTWRAKCRSPCAQVCTEGRFERARERGSASASSSS